MQRQERLCIKLVMIYWMEKSLDENALIEIYKRNIDEYLKENKKMDDFTMNRYILDNLSYRIKNYQFHQRIEKNI